MNTHVVYRSLIQAAMHWLCFLDKSGHAEAIESKTSEGWLKTG